GQPTEDWSLSVPPTDRKFSIRPPTYGDLGSNALLLAVGVNQDVEHAVRAYMTANNFKPRAFVYAEPEGGRLAEGVALSPGDGHALALQAGNAVRQLKDDLQMPTAEVHVFLACPQALAMMIGQKLNTFAACHLYEYEGGD